MSSPLAGVVRFWLFGRCSRRARTSAAPVSPSREFAIQLESHEIRQSSPVSRPPLPRTPCPIRNDAVLINEISHISRLVLAAQPNEAQRKIHIFSLSSFIEIPTADRAGRSAFHADAPIAQRTKRNAAHSLGSECWRLTGCVETFPSLTRLWNAIN